jgi:toxin YoeB
MDNKNMLVSFTPKAFTEYQDWQNQDRKIANKINKLINDIMRHPYEGLGMPEALKHELNGYWSRRIDNEHRLVYFIEDGGDITITQCCEHY